MRASAGILEQLHLGRSLPTQREHRSSTRLQTRSMAPAYTLTAETYALPILHAAQHPSSTVLGLLLAPSSSSSSPSSPAVEVTRAIPILHIDTSSSIYAEVAIDHVAVNAQREGLSVVGMYEAGTQPGEGEAGLSRAARGLSKGLKEKGEVFALAVSVLGLHVVELGVQSR